MRINDKKHWDQLIYNLIYPGFLGSMIYELVPPTKEDFNWDFLSLDWILKLFITLFYVMDFWHLYGDMHERVPLQKRNGWYLACDLFSSCLFFLAFVAVKVERYEYAIYMIAFIPVCFFLYKWKNPMDKKFHSRYILGSFLAAGVYWALSQLSKSFWITDASHFLLVLILFSLGAYIFYVLVYYERKSKAIDEKMYPAIPCKSCGRTHEKS